MKLLIIYTILFLTPTLSLGQRAKIAFEKTTFNLGLVQEDGGKVTREFKLTNKGKAPLLIKHIETTCGWHSLWTFKLKWFSNYSNR